MRIVTVTLNPALDKTGVLDRLLPGELNRMRDVTVDAAGKGINVSKVLAALGSESVATGFIGGGSGEEIVRALDAAGIAHDFVRIAAPNRINLKVLDEGSRLTELNEPGPRISPAEHAELLGKLKGWASADTLFVFSGSIPNGIGADAYAEMIRTVKRGGARAFLDADGAAFANALDAGPEFIKPNTFELLQYSGAPAGAEADNREILRLCRNLLAKGVGRMAVSMGKDGALFASPDDAFFCPGLSVPAQSSVGAGDSVVAAVAFATARGLPWRETAALAMACSAGAVTTIGTKPPSRELVDSLLPGVRFIDL